MTSDIIPFIWLPLLIVGTISTVANFIGSLDDRRYVHKYWPNHAARKRVADGSVRNQALILAIMGSFIMAGVVALTYPPPRTGLAALLVYAGLIGGVAFLVLLSILERRDRKLLMEG